jgi:hypothetical protein
MNTNNPIITPAESRDTRDMRDNQDTRELDARDVDIRDSHDETPYLNKETSSQTNERWRRVQAEFVDDPRKSVTEAHQLVGELMERIVNAFAEERNQLESQWSKGGDVSTEDLRVCLQRYRAFFSRLLPSVNGKGGDA